MSGVFLRGRPDYDAEPAGAILPLFALLPDGPTPGQIAAGTLAGSLGEVCTFTRATVKVVRTAAATAAQLSSGQPAVGDLGLLVEAQHRNTNTWSEDLSHWNLRGTCAVTPGQADPKGGTSAYLVSGVIGASSGDLYSDSDGGASVADVAVSFWIKRVSTTGVLDITTAGGQPGHWLVDLSLLPDAWVRVTAFHPAVTVSEEFTGSTAQGIQIHRASGASPLSFHLWGVQTESGKYPRSYVPTVGAFAVGNKDVAQFATVTLPQAEGWVELDITPLWAIPSTFARLLDTTNESGVFGMTIYVNGSGALICAFVDADSTTSISVVRTWVPGQTYNIRATWKDGNAALYVDGSAVASNNSGTVESPAGHSRVIVGAAGSAGGQSFDGWISDLKFWDTQPPLVD